MIAELEAVIDYIVSNTEKEAFQDKNAFQKAQKDFNKFMQYTERWHIFEFVSAIVTPKLMVIVQRNIRPLYGE